MNFNKIQNKGKGEGLDKAQLTATVRQLRYYLPIGKEPGLWFLSCLCPGAPLLCQHSVSGLLWHSGNLLSLSLSLDSGHSLTGPASPLASRQPHGSLKGPNSGEPTQGLLSGV